MVYYLPILGAVTLAGGTILERLILKGKRVGIRTYQIASFLSIVVVLLPLLYFFWKLDPAALALKNVFIFFLVVLFAVLANFLAFYSLKGERVGKLEPARVMEDFFIILLVLVFSLFSDVYAKNPRIIIPAIIASLALVFSHIEKHHLNFNKYFVAAIFGSFFFALELVTSRLILDFYSPVSFYFFRCAFILVFSLTLFRPNFKELENKTGWMVFITGIVWVAYRVVIYYGYLKIGIVFTTLILMLGPVFIYLFAHFFLGEKMSWKNFLASAIIVAAIVYAIV